MIVGLKKRLFLYMKHHVEFKEKFKSLKEGFNHFGLAKINNVNENCINWNGASILSLLELKKNNI
jgi:hypothetical protein